MGFIYYCSQRVEIFLLVLWNNRLFQQSGNSRDVQLRNRGLFSSSSDSTWGVWWPQIGHLPGQNQGTMVRAAHQLFGRGGASWSKNICYEMAKKKKISLGLLFHICLPLALWGQYTNLCGVKHHSCFMRSACAFALTLGRSHHNHPGPTVEAQTWTAEENGHILVSHPGLSHSWSFVWAIQPVTKVEEHQQGSCMVSPSAFIFCCWWLPWLACQLIARTLYLVLHMQN